MRAQMKNATLLRNTIAYCMFRILSAIVICGTLPPAADLDGDGLDDAWEAANGYDTTLDADFPSMNCLKCSLSRHIPYSFNNYSGQRLFSNNIGR